MATYLKLDGFTGNVTQTGYVGCIELSSYSWGFSVPTQTTVGSSTNRLGSGKITPGDLHLTKKQDQTSAKFMLDSMNGATIPTATLSIVLPTKAGGMDKYQEWKMYEVITSAYNTAGSDHNDQPMENISLNFIKIEISQFTRDSSNNPIAAQRGTFNFQTSGSA